MTQLRILMSAHWPFSMLSACCHVSDWYDLIAIAFTYCRTLITGMASGSIVAFNIDFNRWHYEHQNRY